MQTMSSEYEDILYLGHEAPIPESVEQSIPAACQGYQVLLDKVRATRKSQDELYALLEKRAAEDLEACILRQTKAPGMAGME
jgi:hypothetical protein